MNTSKQLYTSINYDISLPYISSNIITEYDLSKANISSLRYFNIIDDNYYLKLLDMPKLVRETHIGKMIAKDKSIYEYIKNGILKAKELFFKINNIKDNEVVSIKNDAIFLLGTKPIQNNVNEFFTFVPKNTYTFYMSTINKMQIFYNYDQINGTENIDIKGIKDSQLEFHINHMIDFICTIMYMIQTCTIDDTIKFFNEFYEKFIKLELPIEYYRELNSISKFKIGNYLLDYVNEPNYKYILDINNNVYILRDIFSILSDLYFSKTNSGRR